MKMYKRKAIRLEKIKRVVRNVSFYADAALRIVALTFLGWLFIQLAYMLVDILK